MARKSMFLDIVGRFIGKEASQDIEEFTEKVTEAGDAAAKSGDKANKKWKEAYELFGDFLPRGLQRSARSFMRAERSVKRTSLSFKGLKAAITATGIGALIVLLGELIANWDNITNALKNFTTTQLIANAVMAETDKQTNQLALDTTAYIRILKDQNATVEERAQAQKTLGRTIQGVNKLDEESAVHMQFLNELIDENIEKVKAEAKVKALEALEESKREAVEEANFFSRRYRRRQLAEITRQLQDAQRDLNKELADETKLIQEIEDFAKIEELRAKAIEDEVKFQRKLTEATIEYNDELDATEKRRRKLTLQQQDLNRLIVEAEKTTRDANLTYVEQIEAEQELTRLLQERKLLTMSVAEFEKEAAAQRKIDDDNEELATQNRLDSIEKILDKAERAEKKLTQTKFEQQATQLKALERADLAALTKLEATEEEKQAVRERYQTLYDDLLIQQSDAEFAAVEKRQQINDKIRKEIAESGMSDFEIESARLKEQRDKRLLDVEGDLKLEAQIYDDYTRERNALIEQRDKEASQARIAGVFEMGNAFADILNQANQLGEENQERAKKIAVFNILLNQAKALASAIAGASEAAAATGPAAPFTFATYLASMVGAVVGGFAQIKNIMSQGGVSTTGISSTTPSRAAQGTLSPTFGGQTNNSLKIEPVQAFVVESQLSYMQNQANQIKNRTSL